MQTNPYIKRHHHITLNGGGAQEDYDFHTKILGLKSIKKTALYDGDEPIHHLYYGNDIGDVGTLVTCFPMRQSGTAFDVNAEERCGETLLAFARPCGIDYELVGIDDDDRKPYSNGKIP